ncbi:MAG TPA: Ig-like domain-containing protein [Gemmatimonadaceae bacterium]|nr:Ig-like domain-containing protein [Gemmatimonadaceae bacterium]
MAGLTACGDKVTPVTITTTTTPAGNPVVHTVTVSPASVNLQVGGTAQLAASVDADAGVTDRTVTWTSSDATVASVDASGKVTANKAGTATIIASAKAAPTVQGAAAVTVQAAGGGAVPTVTISGLNTTICVAGTGCASVPANLQNFGTGSTAPAGQTGQLDVVLNVDSQGAVLKSVSSTLKCGADSVTQTQTISGAAAPIGADASSAPVTFSFNTAQFDSTGKAALHNGSCTISASASTAAGTQSAASSQTLTLNNADAVYGVISAAKTANDKAGLSWGGGDVTVKVTPVFYTAGRSAVSGTVSLNGMTASATAGALASTQPISTFPGTVTFAASKASGASGGVKAVTDTAVTATVTFVDNSGNPFALTGNKFTNATSLGITRVDNQGPAAGAYDITKQGGANGWLGSNYVFTSAAGQGYTAAAANDNGGVDNVTVSFTYTPTGGSATAVTKASDIPASNVNNAYTLKMIETDALGNATTTTIGTFGVDLTAPTVTTTLAGATKNKVQGTAGTTTTSIADDFSGPNKTFMAITRQNSTATTNAAECVYGFASTGSDSANVNGALPTYNPDGTMSGYCTPKAGAVAGAAVDQGNGDGYYTVSTYGTDNAGNAAAATSYKTGEDNTNPVQGGVSIPASFAGASTVTFPTTATDNMDLVRASAVLNYGNGMGLYYSNTLPGVAFDNVLTTSATYSFSIPNFITSLQQVTAGNAPPTLAVAGDTAATRPTGLTLDAYDEAQLKSNDVTAAFGAATFSGATAYQANANFQSWTVSPTASANVHNAKDSTNTVTLKGIATGPSGLLNIPFSSVTFYYQIGGAGPWIPAGTVSAAAATDDGVTRTWTYSMTWDPPATAPNGTDLTVNGTTLTFRAVGQDAAGNALSTNTSTGVITLTNP